MDPKFLDAIRKNDITTFSSLVKENEGILNQRTADSFNTPLHLASMYGCTEMVSEIVRLCPDMISAENKNMETPIHEACRQENVNVLMLMLEVNPTAACKLNPACKSSFFLACSHGHLDLVNLLLNLSEMVEPEAAGFDQTCIHIAVSRGHTDVVRELLNKRPELTQVIEDNGNSLLHNACSKGHREIVWILQRRDPNLALQYNNNGYTPLHLAVMNGKVSILNDFVSSCATSFHYLTREEETVFHLAVRYGCYDALVFLVEVCNGTNLLHCHDRYGNSVLHLAVTGGRHKIAEFLIINTKLDINTRNSEGKTALDILDQAKDSAENRQLQATFIRAGGKRNFQPSSWSLEVDKANSLSPIASKLSLSQRYTANEMEVPSEMVSYDCTSPPEVSKSMESRSPQPQLVLVPLVVCTKKDQWEGSQWWLKQQTGYVAATWVILPHSKGMQWLSVVLLALGGGSLGTIFIGLSVMLVEHWLRKSKWRKTRKESGDGAADLERERESENSDFESSYLQGYHSY